MPFGRARAAAACCLTLLASCVSEVAEITPASHVRMMAELRAGTLSLACGASCRDAWMARSPHYAALDRAERWSDLALGIMQTGYGGDLAYYELGRAAQGMGYHRAAIAYYAQAMALADGSDATVQCGAARPTDDPCQGVRITAMAPGRIAASRAALDREVADATPVKVRRPRPTAPIRLAGGPRSGTRAKEGEGLPVAGLAQAIDTATLQVRGRTIPLSGIVGRPDSYAAQLQALIDAHGNTVRCVRVGVGYTCTLPNGTDLAKAALANGIATLGTDAPADFRAEEQAARAAHRGLWQTVTGVSG